MRTTVAYYQKWEDRKICLLIVENDNSDWVKVNGKFTEIKDVGYISNVEDRGLNIFKKRFKDLEEAKRVGLEVVENLFS